ncbi:MAG: acyltransferase [Anaerolineales bacterium]|nr:acyltransferase [Anaerolineales bacterium]
MSQSVKKLDQLTVTRFIAALSVMLFHGGRYIGILAYFPMLTAGPVAVSYFYVLSGFVMALAYYRPGTRFDFRSYGLARFSRIYPVYILAFVLTCIYYIDLMAKIKSDKVLANVFLYQAWIPEFAESFNIAAWSLSVEVFFYVLFPFLLIFAMRRSVKGLIWASLGFWVFSQIVHSILKVRFMPESAAWLAYYPLFHLNSFLLGAAGGIWYVSNAPQLKVNQSANRFLLLLSLGVILLLLSLRELTTSFPTSFSLDNGLLAPFFLIIVLSLAFDTTRLAQGLSHPWLVLLGDASYALYILHIPFRWMMEKYLARFAIPYETMYLAYIPVSIAICILVFKYIEVPARDWLRKNSHMLLFIFLDVLLIYIMTRLSFVFRLGDEIVSYRRTQNFALRTGLVIFFLSFLVFQFYKTSSWRSLAWAVLTGTAALTGLMYFAWIKGWVEGFPRPIILMIAVFVYSSIYLSRFLVPFLQPSVRLNIKGNSG